MSVNPLEVILSLLEEAISRAEFTSTSFKQERTMIPRSFFCLNEPAAATNIRKKDVSRSGTYPVKSIYPAHHYQKHIGAGMDRIQPEVDLPFARTMAGILSALYISKRAPPRAEVRQESWRNDL